MKKHILFLAATSLFAATGCSVFESSARKHQLTSDGKTAYWFDYNSDRRGAFVIPADKKFQVISEPSPDTAVQNALKLAGSLNYQSVTGQLSADLSQQIVQLGERTEMIMFLRETMFRLSETGNNAGWSSEDYKDLYTEIVNAAVTLAEAEKTSAEAQKTKAEAEYLKAQTAIKAIPTNSATGNPLGGIQTNPPNQPTNQSPQK